MSQSCPRNITVLGAGPAGLTAAKLLADGGWSVRLVASGARQSRAIALPAQTEAMLTDIWGKPVQEIVPTHRLSQRRVAWSGPAADVIEIAALSLDAAELAAGLETCLSGVEIIADVPRDTGAYLIDARGPALPEACQITAGTRSMAVWPALPVEPQLSHQSETLAGDGFWMFLLPTSCDRMTVQLAIPEARLDLSRLAERLRHASGGTLSAHLAPLLGSLETEPPHHTAIAPRLGLPPASAAALPAGDRAVSFDPISGDGTGQGLRSVCLAVGALNALAEGGSAAAILGHVANRYDFAFSSHLTHCLRYYGSIQVPEAWSGEIHEMRQALSRIGLRRMTERPAFRMHFEGKRGPILADA